MLLSLISERGCDRNRNLQAAFSDALSRSEKA